MILDQLIAETDVFVPKKIQNGALTSTRSEAGLRPPEAPPPRPTGKKLSGLKKDPHRPGQKKFYFYFPKWITTRF